MSGDALTEHVGPLIEGAALREIAELIGATSIPVEVVDIGASPLVGEPPAYAALVEAGLARVTAFEPDPEALAALRKTEAERESGSTDTANKAGTTRHLGHAVGDGQRHVLRRCDAAGFSSLLEPDARQLAVLTDFPRLASVVERTEVDTVRLDAVPDLERADLLTLDVQGSEPAVLDGGRSVLASVFAVQVEVAFHRLYEGGPTLADVDRRLRDAGLVPHIFVTTRTWPLAPIPWDDPLQAHSRHLVEADLLYVADLTRLADRTDASLRAAALIACGAYGSIGLALACVTELVRRGTVPEDTPARVRRIASVALGLDQTNGGHR